MDTRSVQTTPVELSCSLLNKKVYVAPSTDLISTSGETSFLETSPDITHNNGSGNTNVDPYEDGGEEEILFAPCVKDSIIHRLCPDLADLVFFFALLFCACSSDDQIGTEATEEGTPISYGVELLQNYESNRRSVKKKEDRNFALQDSKGSIAYMHEYAIGNIVDYRNIDNSAGELLVQESSSPSRSPMRKGAAVISVDGMSNEGFSSFAYRDDGQSYYYNIRSDKHGNLSQQKVWPLNTSLRFYAVHPYMEKSSVFGGNADGLTCDFEVNRDVEKQEDLMYASTDVMTFQESGLAPLQFRHALTAIHFSLGSNPDFGKRITSIAVKNIYTKGTYTLPKGSTANTADPAEGSWSNLSGQGDIVLSGLDVETDGHPNASILSPTQTFLLLPRADLNGVTIEIGFEDGTTLSSTFSSGEWKAGYTYTYKFSKRPEQWDYYMEVYPSDGYTLKYTDTGTSPSYPSGMGWFGVKSYKQKSDGTKQAVPWEVVKYEYSDDDGATWVDNGLNLPSWLLNFPDGAAGSTSYDTWYVDVDAASYIGESVTERDQIIQAGPVRTDYDLSTHDIKGNSISQTTANCYVISHPGTYKLPLVYGNAIKNGAVNSVAFNPSAGVVSGFTKMGPFLNYKGEGITNPWIKTDGTPTSVELVWSDSQSLYNLLKDKLTISGDYLCFDATDVNNIRQGNVVVAVKDADGVVMWSWHLWFAPDDVLDLIEVTHQGNRNKKYYLTKETLGYRTASRYGSTYSVPRKIRVTVEQVEAGTDGVKKQGLLYLTQNPGGTDLPAQVTLYQWGRKDAMPGYTTYFPSDGFNPGGAGKVSYATAIQNPGVHYCRENGAPQDQSGWCSTSYGNVWSAQTSGRDNDIFTYKTVYDPSPAGVHVPGSYLLTMFTYNSTYRWYFDNDVTTNVSIASYSTAGINFYTSPAKDATIFFPVTGIWSDNGEYEKGHAVLGTFGNGGHYWMTQAHTPGTALALFFNQTTIVCRNGDSFNQAHACAIRPEKE